MKSDFMFLQAFQKIREEIEKEKEKTELNKKNIANHDEEFEKVMKRVNDIIKQAQENKEELKSEIVEKIDNIKIRIPEDGKDGIDGKNGKDR